MKTFMALMALAATLAMVEAHGNTVYCYYGAWAEWRSGNGKYTIQDIDSKLCTHVTYAFILPNSDGSINYNGAYADMPAFRDLKKKNPNVKLLVSLGGWSAGSTPFSQATNNGRSLQQLVNNIHNFITSERLDGIDIDWEYPGQRGGSGSDRESYINFLRELRNKLGWNHVISAAVSSTPDGGSYDVGNMNKYLTFFNIMTYDFYGSWDSTTGFNSPLYAAWGESNAAQLNVDYAVSQWIKAGAKSEKVLAGLAFYGRSFTLSNSDKHGVGAPVRGPGNAGPISQSAGELEFIEICLDLKRGRWHTVFDNQAGVPYSYKGNQWVGYDNQRSLKEKCNFAKQKNLGGVMIWSVESDDARDLCGEGHSPLLNAVHQGMN